MLFNCFQCGRTISSKKDICVFCKTDVSNFATEFNKIKIAPQADLKSLKEKYTGTLFSFLLKSK